MPSIEEKQPIEISYSKPEVPLEIKFQDVQKEEERVKNVKKSIIVSMDDLAMDNLVANPIKIQLHECSKCDFKSKKKSLLKIHFRSIHDPYKAMQHDPELKFSCNECDFRGKTEESLAKHSDHKHNGLKCHLCDFHFTSSAKNGSKTIAHLNDVHSDVPTGSMKKTLSILSLI